MKNHWFAALLCIVFAFAATGCGSSQSGGNKKRRYAGTPQTGTNIPRWSSDSTGTREARSKQRKAKPKRERRQAKDEKAEKPRRERQERRRRAADDEVITRGGFR